MNGNDAQTFRDTRYFLGRLLGHADMLPPGLATMLRRYESQLDSASPGTWSGIGNAAQYDALARRISQSITDGELAAGKRLDFSADNWYCWAQTRENVMGALRLLAVRGELDLRDGMYYVGSCDERS